MCLCLQSWIHTVCRLYGSQSDLSKVSCQWHLTPVLQTLQWLFVTTRIKAQLLIMTYKAAHCLQPYLSTFLYAPTTPAFFLSSSMPTIFPFFGFCSDCTFCLRVFFPQIFIWLPPSCHSDLYSVVTPQRCLPSRSGYRSTPLFLSHYPILFYL